MSVITPFPLKEKVFVLQNTFLKKHERKERENQQKTLKEKKKISNVTAPVSERKFRISHRKKITI
jgi:hypothetical protein